MDARRLRPWLTLFFASVSAASLCGGLVHGFFLDEQSLGAKILWPMTLLATGVTALSLWAIGAKLLFSSRNARGVIAAATLEFACFAYMILFQTDAFWLAWFENIPPVFFSSLQSVWNTGKQGLETSGSPRRDSPSPLLQPPSSN